MREWRKIKCPTRHEIKSEGICINGVLYYLGRTYTLHGNDVLYHYMIVCFDVRSEKFKYIDVESVCKLINYKGKLAVVYWKTDDDDDEDDDDDDEDDVDADEDADEAIDELRVWILEDVEKQEWTKNVYTLKDDEKFFLRHGKISIVGGTAMGEIVFSMDEYTSEKPFYVFYFNPERNTLQSVEIKGFREYYHQAAENYRVLTFVNHVEDLNVNDAKLLTSSIYDPYVKAEEEEEEEEEEESSSEE